MRAVIRKVHEVIKEINGQSLGTSDWAMPPKRELGDFAIPCFKLSKALGKAPPLVAAELAPQVMQKLSDFPLVKSVQAVGPYLNISFSSEDLNAELHRRVSQDKSKFGGLALAQDQCICIDFSSPNIAKEMALHHLRSTAIGNALSKIAALQGAKVVRINYLGDWGTAHGKNILALKSFGSEAELRVKGVAYMLSLYVRFNQEAKSHPQLNEDAKAAFARLEEGDTESRRVWNLFRDISIEEFKKTYARLGVGFDTFDGESLYEKRMEPVIQEIHQKLGTEISEGALICHLPGHEIPILLKKDDGASLYITRDLVAISDRFERFHYDQNWYVVAVQQKLHFKQLFDLVKALGKDFAGRSEHISFGMLSFGDKTMKSREGNVIFLNDVLDEAKNRALKIIQEKNPSLPNAEEVAEMIGTGAVLFFDLSQNRNHDIKFDWEKALSFEGDTAPFIQYVHARCASLKIKVEKHLTSLEATSTPAVMDDLYADISVRELLGQLASFELYCERAFCERDPSQVASSLLNISKAFNQLYHRVRFLNESSIARLQFLLGLVKLTQQTLAQGLGLLGIRAPEAM